VENITTLCEPAFQVKVISYVNTAVSLGTVIGFRHGTSITQFVEVSVQFATGDLEVPHVTDNYNYHGSKFSNHPK
jgi:hypothetical protein